MSTDFKTKCQKLAQRTINDTFGSVAQDVTVIKPLRDGYDTESGLVIATTSEVNVKGTITPWTEDNSAALSSDTIVTNDIKLLIAAQDMATLDAQITNPRAKILPLVADFHTFEINNIDYELVSFRLDAAGALYVIRCRNLLDNNAN